VHVSAEGQPHESHSLSREQVREIDRRAIECAGVAGVVLMENAGRGAADRIEAFMRAGGAEAGGRVAVVAGAGNNGGDGYVIARHLSIRGMEVVTFLVAPVARIAGDALVNLQILRKLGGDVRELAGGGVACGAALAEQLGDVDVIVDAVGGTGMRGALRGGLAGVVEAINAAPVKVGVVAVDIPTGLDCDTGRAEGPAVRAAMTVTFVARKKGFDAPGASDWTGEVCVVDIGVPARRVSAMGQ